MGIYMLCAKLCLTRLNYAANYPTNTIFHPPLISKRKELPILMNEAAAVVRTQIRSRNSSDLSALNIIQSKEGSLILVSIFGNSP